MCDKFYRKGLISKIFTLLFFLRVLTSKGGININPLDLQIGFIKLECRFTVSSSVFESRLCLNWVLKTEKDRSIANLETIGFSEITYKRMSSVKGNLAARKNYLLSQNSWARNIGHHLEPFTGIVLRVHNHRFDRNADLISLTTLIFIRS